MRSKAQTFLTATLVLHRTRLDKCNMKKYGINGQLRNKLFLIIIHRFSLVKAAMNALHICKMCNGVSKTPSISSFFNCPSVQCCTIVNWKTRKRSNTLQGSQWIGGGRIFLKTFRPLSLMKTYRMSLISAGSISMDSSTFNSRTLWLCFVLFFIRKKNKKSPNFLFMFCAFIWTR